MYSELDLREVSRADFSSNAIESDALAQRDFLHHLLVAHQIVGDALVWRESSAFASHVVVLFVLDAHFPQVIAQRTTNQRRHVFPITADNFHINFNPYLVGVKSEIRARVSVEVNIA